MLELRSAVIIAVLAPLLSGCGPSPEDMCAHLMKLAVAEIGPEVELKSESELAEIEQLCVGDAEADKKTSSKDFKRQAECVMAAASLDEATACERHKPAKSPM